MYQPKIKICGLQDVDTALHAISCGVDALGFVFAKSSRQISAELAASITCHLPPLPARVGVFVDSTLEEIHAVAHKAKLTHIQLHGNESPDFCRALGLPVIKAIRIRSIEDFDQCKQFDVSAFLFDTFNPAKAGGTGERFDHTLLKSQTIPRPYFVAGGLRAENVGEVVRELLPYGVDVSGGVESNGKKDPTKISQFIAHARQAGRD